MKRRINWFVVFGFIAIGLFLGSFWWVVVYAMSHYLEGGHIARTVAFIVFVIVVWELFEFCIEKAIKRVCCLPHHDGEYPWN